MEKKSAEHEFNLAMARAAKTLEALGLNEDQVLAVVELITDISIRAINFTREGIQQGLEKMVADQEKKNA